MLWLQQSTAIPNWEVQRLAQPALRASPELLSSLQVSCRPTKKSMITLFKFAAVLIAAILTGNWFLAEVRKAKINRQPWYKPYLTVPGLIILAALSLPVVLWVVQQH